MEEVVYKHLESYRLSVPVSQGVITFVRIRGDIAINYQNIP